MNKTQERLIFLDLLRGTLAIMVMGYHLLYYVHGHLLYNIGLYSVYGFFVLSGLSLHYAYKNKLNSGINWTIDFANARIYRIFPLLLLVTITWAMYRNVTTGSINGLHVLVSMIGLFGFADPGSNTITGGAWSIGIEIVYYFSFPVLIALALYRPLLTGLILLIAQVSYIEYTLPSQGSLVPYWKPYIQPLSFIFYFYAGIMISMHLDKVKIIFGQRVALSLFVTAFLAVVLTPSDSTLELLAGPTGIFMIASVIFMVMFAAVINTPDKLKPISQYLGNISYGVYLWHLLILTVAKEAGVSGIALTLLVAIATIITASITYYLFEEPIRNYGRIKYKARLADQVA